MTLSHLALFRFFAGMSTIENPDSFGGYYSLALYPFFPGFTESGAPPTPTGGVYRPLYAIRRR